MVFGDNQRFYKFIEVIKSHQSVMFCSKIWRGGSVTISSHMYNVTYVYSYVRSYIYSMHANAMLYTSLQSVVRKTTKRTTQRHS